MTVCDGRDLHRIRTAGFALLATSPRVPSRRRESDGAYVGRVVLPCPSLVTLDNVTTTGILLVLLPVAAGAMLGFVPNWLLEGRKDRYARRNRWDEALYQASVDLTSSARRSDHLIEQAEKGDKVATGQIDGEQQKLRVALEQIFMLGDVSVQRAARRVVHHTWAQRLELETGVDPHPATAGLAPKARSKLARRAFYLAVRRQLRVPDADSWAPPISERPEQESELGL